ncbi:glycosyltransferase family 4 protein [uncultured Friedmanniella sp.]|uniref:glycosyltransferase family 4 protein n=1 Tax=uncultured Friedmanniella sp. TaxID=335381 RepID=UPI0035CB5D76
MRVLLVTHEASRSGAPRVALLVAKCLVEMGHVVEVISQTSGPMLADFEKVVPTSVQPFSRLRRRLWRTTGLRRVAWLVDTTLAMATLMRRRPELVYVNSTAASVYLTPARRLGCRTLLHAHESGPLVEEFLRKARVAPRLQGTTLVGCSPSVRSALAELSQRDEDDVAMLPSVPDDAEVERRSHETPDQPYGRDELVVGSCGSVEWRKGADLWVQVASLVQTARPDLPVRFVWIGDQTEALDLPGQERPATFAGPSPNPYAHMRRFDIATLTSRDDPFPLVVLESMLVGVPVVAFDVGSVADQVGDAGVLVTPQDTQAFADAVVALLTDAAERSRLGRAGQERVRELYSTRAFAAGLHRVLTS